MLASSDGWRHWSSPAKDVHDVISEIILASQLTKQFVNVIGRNSSFEKCQTYGLVKKITRESTNFTTDPSPKKKPPASALTNSFDSTPSEGDGDTKFAPTVCSSVESLESTPIPSGKGGAQINRRSSSKKHHSMRKPPPHVFKVVLSSEGPAAKSGTAISLRQLEARKLNESRKLTTPSPLYKRRSGTLVQKPCSVISTNPELRSSSTSQSSIIRGSIERKARLQNSASVRRSTEKFVEACRLLMEEEAQQKREAGIKDGSPPLVIKPLSFDSPSLRKAPAKRSKNWLIHRFSKSSVSGESSNAVATAGIVKQRKKASKGSNLPTLISRLPAQKPETRVQDTPARVSDAPARGSNHGATDSLPLPPAHRSSAAGLAMKAMRDKKSGMTSYALAPVSTPRSSREVTTVDSNTVVLLKEKSKCSVGCPSKDANSHSKSRTSGLDAGIRATTEQSMPSYMRPKSGAGKENNNNNNNAKMDSFRRSSAGILQKSAVPPKHSSGLFLFKSLFSNAAVRNEFVHVVAIR